MSVRSDFLYMLVL